MDGDISTVKTKILLPRRRRNLLHRARLVDFIHEHIDRKLILISASAGYGKTSLLMDFAHDTELPVCWYSLDEWDRDPRVFLEYLVASIRERFPRFGDRTLGGLRGGVHGEGLRSIVGTLVNEIHEVVPEYFALAIDDYHLVSDSKDVASLFSFFLRRLPENCHVLLSSRTTTLGLPSIELVARGELEGLGNDDLKFTGDEIQRLLRQNHNLDLPREEADRLAQQSEGWITAILLTTHTLWKGLLQTMALAKGDDSQIFAYLAREVLQQQPDDVQRFLTGSSVLQRMNSSLCNELLDMDDARDMLSLLEDKNLFISRLEGDGEDWFRYHQLFQEFLTAKLQEEDDRYGSLHLRAGRMFEAQESWDEAIRHYLDAGAYDDAQRLVEAVASWAFSSGRLGGLLFWTDSMIQAGYGSPWMYYWQSRVLTNYGRLDDAARALQKAKHGFAERSDNLGMVRALLQEGSIHRLRSEYAEAIAKTDQALSLMGDNQDVGLTAMAHSIVGICHGLQGELELGLARLREALSLFESLDEDRLYDVADTLHNIGAIYLAVDVEKYLHYTRKALAVWRRLGARGPMAMTLNNIGVAQYRQGRYAEALDTLQEALAEGEAMGLLRAQAYPRASLGDVYRIRGDYALAEEEYTRALASAEEADEGFLVGYLLDAMGNLERLRGDFERADQLLDQAIEKAYDHGSEIELATYQISRGILLHVKGSEQEALRTLQQAASSFQDGTARQESAKCYFHLASALFAIQASEEALLHLEMALDIMAQSGFDPMLVDEASGSCALLDYAAREAAVQGHAGLIRKLKARTEPPGEAGSRLPTQPAPRDLEFTALGPSTVRRDGAIVDAQELRLRAKEVLFFFLAHPVVTKERIVAALWPELSLAKAHSTFHFYLFQVRRLLGGTDAISYESGAYRLGSRQYQYDVDEFHRSLVKASRVTRAQREKYLSQAVSLYRGDYLEDIFSEWTDELRASLRREYHQALEDLAKHCRAQGRLEEGAEFFRRLLDKDPLREDIHRELMGILLAMGDRAGAIGQFEKLRRILEEELGTDPSDETLDLLSGLLPGG
ncbi:MAG TPA: tetratricopeptide repeat protein [Anaerolineae bacterium]|nr:tetratricopeptide repeat protein [Anaerolineae bacterium]